MLPGAKRLVMGDTAERCHQIVWVFPRHTALRCDAAWGALRGGKVKVITGDRPKGRALVAMPCYSRWLLNRS